MKTFWKNFYKDEQGQDLIEYSLLLAFVALAAAALYSTSGDKISTIWSKTNSSLTDATS